MTELKLGKPPVVESWIAFDFEPSPNKVEWNGELANKLADSLSDRFPQKEDRWRTEFSIEILKAGQQPVSKKTKNIFDSVRIQNEESTRIFQIADDRIVCNQLKADGDWPGFDNLLDESLDLLTQYSQFFCPSGIKCAELHYVDIVEIPPPENDVSAQDEVVELDDYFELVRELPQTPFGLIASYKTEYVVICPQDKEPLVISLQTIPPPPEKNAIRIRLDWNKKCRKIDFSSHDTIREGLQKNHSFMAECFRASFTDKALELFEPEDSG